MLDFGFAISQKYKDFKFKNVMSESRIAAMMSKNRMELFQLR